MGRRLEESTSVDDLYKFFEELFTERSEVSQMELIEPSTAK
jgi:hypothetical protein